ncbi:hypothetical protein [Sphaerisporangium sp. NPDC051011]|uniref:hypothetical protein n=1 Tax=Sphaerisporangium sp. NPDC051011 TaxID=3155792 RepID=UPI0033E4D58D
MEKKYGIDPNELKQDELGRGAQISRFDVYRGSDGYYWLIRKDGKAKIRTASSGIGSNVSDIAASRKRRR